MSTQPKLSEHPTLKAMGLVPANRPDAIVASPHIPALKQWGFTGYLDDDAFQTGQLYPARGKISISRLDFGRLGRD